MISYQPTKQVKEHHEKIGDPIPTQYIPRKPHKNGLLIYHACTYIKHPNDSNKVLPFIIDAMPHIIPNDANPHEFIKWIMIR